MSFEIINSECLEAMREMESDSVDAIVADPPYALSFCGAEWDSFNGRNGRQTTKERQDEGRRYAEENKGAPRYGNSHGKKVTLGEMLAFQEAMTPIFQEALRVAKPGAHMLCFGGTRTFHRLMCAIEDAGWEIRDTIMYVYGCLDEETEVLVGGEFVPYNKAKIGSLALGYDIERGTFSWQRIEDTYLYDYDDTAYAIQSDSTDQLVSRNHRCIVERGGVEQFVFAEQVAREREASVPVLEGLHGLLDRLPLPVERASDKEQDVLEGVLCGDSADAAKEAQDSRTERDVCHMRQDVLHTTIVDAEGKRTALLKGMQRQGACSGVAAAQQGASHSSVGGEKAAAQGADDWTAEPFVEGRCVKGERERTEAACCSGEMPGGIPSDGTEGRLDSGASTRGGTADWKASGQERGRASHRSRPVEQRPFEPDAVPDEQCAQALRSAWGAKTTLARVTPVHYEGKMWCIKVATGAFVARRHGKIFITGNSGFPHGMDVSKAIDKALGAERKKRGGYGEHSGNVGFGMKNRCPKCGKPYFSADPCTCPREDKQPITDAAAQWDGWHTRIKPAWEPIVVARKPLDGTVAHNILTYGVGAMNIDACRIPVEPHDPSRDGEATAEKRYADKGSTNFAAKPGPRGGSIKGRFPANLVHDGSQEVLELFPETGKSSGGGMHVRGTEGHESTGVYGNYTNGAPTDNVGLGDSGSAARFFYCASDDKGRFPANLIHDGSDEVVGLFPESKGQQGDVMGTEPSKPAKNAYGDFGNRTAFQKRGDIGSASRFFYCAKASKKDRNRGCEGMLTWGHGQELTQLLEKSSQLIKDISESGMLKTEDLSLFTGSFGNERMVLSRKEWSFIISMVTRLTTDLKTSSLSQSSSTNEYILDAIKTSEESGTSLAKLAEKLNQLRQDSTGGETDMALSAVVALFDVLSEIRRLASVGNQHSTVKPNALMRYLVRLVCPVGGVVLDPFMGSGSTGVACMDEGMSFIGVEMDESYCEIARGRISSAESDNAQMRLF